MFGIGNIMGAVGKGLSIPQVLSSIQGPLGGMVGGAMKSMNATQGLFGGIAGKAAQKAGKLGAGDTHKAAYLSVLAHAMEKAHKSPHFNLETQINDLWTKLSNVKNNSAHLDKLHEAIGGSDPHANELQQLLQGLGGQLNQITSKMK